MKRSIRIAAASSLLALGALGLVACGGGDDDETSNEEEITQVGNEWAPLFAEDAPDACDYMFPQPLCEEFFGRVGEPPEAPHPSEFQKSFADATVEGVVIVERAEQKANKALAEFSNGKLVELTDDPRGIIEDPEGHHHPWFIYKVGAAAGESYKTEAAELRE